jgi:hypothetical protein
MFILQDQTATTALEEDVISAGMEMSGKTVAKNSSLRVQLKMLGMHLEEQRRTRVIMVAEAASFPA